MHNSVGDEPVRIGLDVFETRQTFGSGTVMAHKGYTGTFCAPLLYYTKSLNT